MPMLFPGRAMRQPSLLSQFLFAIFLFWAGLTARADADGVPDMDLIHLDGRPAALSDVVGKGKWVLVMFWSVDCAICRREMPQMARFHARHRDRDAIVLGVAIDGRERIPAIRRFLREHGANFPSLVGELPVIAVNYELATGEPFRGTPTFWFFSPDGALVGNNPGPVRITALERFMARHRQAPGAGSGGPADRAPRTGSPAPAGR